MKLLSLGQSTETVHVENGFKFKFDVMRIMFAPGNGTERTRFANIRFAKSEIVVDMFAGLGYFTIPLAKNNLDRIRRFVAIEKNPLSYEYLKENLVLNGVNDKVQALCGDNRHAGDDLKGKCDRVLLGYLPNTKDFIPRALVFANPMGCLLHYHYLAKKNAQHEAVVAEFDEVFGVLAMKPKSFEVVAISKVKNYAPHLLHYCADVMISLQ